MALDFLLSYTGNLFRKQRFQKSIYGNFCQIPTLFQKNLFIQADAYLEK